MRVLTAVLTHPWHVSTDVSRVQIGRVERRIEKLDQPVVAAHETRIDRVHRHTRSCDISGT